MNTVIVELAQEKWREKLLKSRKPGIVYQLIVFNDKGINDIFFTYKDGWQIKADLQHPPAIFTDVDEAAEYLIALGVEEYDKMVAN